MAEDPFAVLGVEHGADEATLRAARRRLAKDQHPDREGGDTVRMERLNAAFEQALAELHRRPAEVPREADPDPSEVVVPRRAPGRFAHDVASFTIEALPAEAFEALLVVATWLGEVLVDEPPYQLDIDLGDPFDCWCRLDLVPDAGASTVAVTLIAHEGRPLPDIDTVRDAWVANLNQLGRPD